MFSIRIWDYDEGGRRPDLSPRNPEPSTALFSKRRINAMEWRATSLSLSSCAWKLREKQAALI